MKVFEIFRFNRIFWKLFGIIWLTNFAMIAVVAFVMAHGSARSKYVQNYQAKVRLLAEVIIDEYETKGVIPNGNSRLLMQLKRRHRIAPDLQLDIQDHNGSYIYKSRWRKDRNIEPNNYKPNNKERGFSRMILNGDSSQPYTALYLPHRPPRFIVEAMTSLLSVQLVLLLITSAIVSALISWRIVRPLEYLGRFGQQYAKGIRDKNSAVSGLAVDAALLARGDEIGDLARELASMVEQVDKAFSVQRSLLHDVSHELRAPLARLQVAASLIEQRNGDSLYITKVHEECARLNALIDEVLELARMDSANLKLEPVALSDCIKTVVDNVRFEYPQRLIKCDFSLLPQPANAVLIQANGSALSRALENIVRNACKYSPENKPIDVSIERSPDGGWIIVCRDYGAGIPPQELALLKQPFYRGGGVMHGQGFGLGLSIADKAIKQHGGELHLQNHPDGGLQVRVILRG